MRLVYAHEALVQMNPTDDPAGVGAAITVALCGDWRHEPPCPLAPHHVRTDRSGADVSLRILFAVEPNLEGEVRRLIDQTLASGRQQTPEGAMTEWRLLTSTVSTVRESERDHGQRLIRS